MVFLARNDRGEQVVFREDNAGVRLVSVEIDRVDGLEDDCGSRPRITLPPPFGLPSGTPPSFGDELRPVMIFPTTEIIEGEEVSIDVQIGPVTFEEPGDIVIRFPGLPDFIRIRPTFAVEIARGLLELAREQQETINDTLGDLAEEIEQQGTQLDCLEAAICEEQEANGEFTLCDGAELIAASGSGLQFLAMLMISGFNAVSVGQRQYCQLLPSNPDNVNEVSLLQYSVTELNEQGVPVAIGPEVRFIRVQCVIQPTYERLFRGIATSDPTGRFGFVSFGVGDASNISWTPVESQWYLNGYHEVPSLGDGDRFVRVASYVGVDLEIFDTGIR